MDGFDVGDKRGNYYIIWVIGVVGAILVLIGLYFIAVKKGV